MNNKQRTTLLSFLLICTFVTNLFQGAALSKAATVDELQQEIKIRNESIANLQKEIETYQNQVNEIGKQADTLSNAIKTLDLSRKQIEANIRLTQNKIDSTNLQIRQLGIDINNKQGTIEDNQDSIRNALKQINETESRSLLSMLLSENDLSTFWNDVDTLNRFQGSIQERIEELRNLKQGLENNKTQTEKKKADLLALQKQLALQKEGLQEAINEKNSLLKTTKATEANYKAIIADKEKRIEAFEKELLLYESELNIAIDPNRLPTAGKGIIRWPLDNVYVTQYFGNTPFATANPQGYAGQGHNGIDLRASIGTPVKASLSGIVSGTGNTSLVRGCYSYGKWVLIQHPNGLSTLYAHLSVVSVKKGDAVQTGQTIALSGNTGYVTGPHLHFTVFATQGVRIGTLPNSKNCKGAVLPLSDTRAYLNPLSYL